MDALIGGIYLLAVYPAVAWIVASAWGALRRLVRPGDRRQEHRE